jgi:hypothetical protein
MMWNDTKMRSVLHIELCPKWYRSRKASKTITKLVETIVGSTFDVDDKLVCTMLQQLRASGDRSELF